MTLEYTDDWLTIHGGDARTVLVDLPDESVHCVVTSPPYWGLRDYGTATWVGGDEGCDHVQSRSLKRDTNGGLPPAGQGTRGTQSATLYRDICGKCNATRIDSQLGLEATPEEYVANIVAVFREVRRVLRKDGTLWLVLGDSYSGSWSGHSMRPEGGSQREGGPGFQNLGAGYPSRPPNVPGLKPKDLVGIPWRVAFALQADGWYLRSDIVWSKPNPMPESVTDRPTKSHEMIFLLTRSPRYYFDGEAVREGLSGLLEDASGGVVLPASEQGESVGAMSRVQRRAGAGMAQASWLDGPDERGEPSLAPDRVRAGDASEARPVAGEASGIGGVSAESGRTRGEPSVVSVAKGSGEMGEVLPRSSYVDGRSIDPDGRGMGGHQVDAGLSLPLLRERRATDDGPRHPGEQGRDAHQTERSGGVQALQQSQGQPSTGRNLRSVWTIATQPYPGAHFAVFPEKLVEPCILAGTSERGVCPECGAPWERMTRSLGPDKPNVHVRSDAALDGDGSPMDRGGTHNSGLAAAKMGSRWAREHLGWRPSCVHVALRPSPAVVLDCFAGSGTVARVANRLSRRAVLIDLNPEYLRQQLERNRDIPLGLESA